MNRRDLLKQGFALAASGLLLPDPIKRSWALDRTMLPGHDDHTFLGQLWDEVSGFDSTMYRFEVSPFDKIVHAVSFFVQTPDGTVSEVPLRKVREDGYSQEWAAIAPEGRILETTLAWS